MSFHKKENQMFPQATSIAFCHTLEWSSMTWLLDTLVSCVHLVFSLSPWRQSYSLLQSCHMYDLHDVLTVPVPHSHGLPCRNFKTSLKCHLHRDTSWH